MNIVFVFQLFRVREHPSAQVIEFLSTSENISEHRDSFGLDCATGFLVKCFRDDGTPICSVHRILACRSHRLLATTKNYLWTAPSFFATAFRRMTRLGVQIFINLRLNILRIQKTCDCPFTWGENTIPRPRSRRNHFHLIQRFGQTIKTLTISKTFVPRI